MKTVLDSVLRPWGPAVRAFAAVQMVLVGLSRCGFYSYGSDTRFPAGVYGVALLVCALAVLPTNWVTRFFWPGRVAAGVSFVVTVSFGVDTLLLGGSMVSVLMLFSLAAVMANATVGHDRN